MRFCKWFTLILCVLCLSVVFTAYADDAAEDYDTIQTLMEKAVKDPDQADAQFKLITRYYTKNTALTGYKDADTYYRYAKGRLAFSEKDYDEAYKCFMRLKDAFMEGVEVSYYQRFCEAMWSKQDADELKRIDDYEAAIAGFIEAKDLTEWPAACEEQIADCEERCGELIKEEAAKCCSDGDHEKAQEYYQRLVAFENKSYSREGKRLLEACIAHSGFSVGTPTVEYLGDRTARIVWASSCDKVKLSVTRNKKTSSVTVNENYYDVTDIGPGDKIKVSLESLDSGLAVVEAELTVPAVVSVKTHYDDGVKFMTAALYKDAYDCFVKAGSYEDSSLQAQYCMGMLCLADADEDEAAAYLKWAAEHTKEAKKYFTLLSGAGYEGADKLAAYCDARVSEYEGMTQSAIDRFAVLGGVLDSSARYMRLERGERLPRKEPPAELPPVRTAVKGIVSKGVDVMSAPSGTSAKETGIKIRAEQEVSVVGTEGDYWLIEVQNGNKLYRVWYPRIRISQLTGKVQECGKNARKARITADTEVLYGPGSRYASKKIQLPRNTNVTAYEAEDAYTMIEYKQDGKACRGWVLTDTLNK